MLRANEITSRCSDGQLTENFTQHTDMNANADVWFSVYVSSMSSIWALKVWSMHRNACKFVHNNHCLDLVYWMYKMYRDFCFELPILSILSDKNILTKVFQIVVYTGIRIYALNFHVVLFLQFLFLGVLMLLPITITSSCNGHCYFLMASFDTTLWRYIPMMGLWLGVWRLRTQVSPLIVYLQRWASPFKCVDLLLLVAITIL